MCSLSPSFVDDISLCSVRFIRLLCVRKRTAHRRQDSNIVIDHLADDEVNHSTQFVRLC